MSTGSDDVQQARVFRQKPSAFNLDSVNAVAHRTLAENGADKIFACAANVGQMRYFDNFTLPYCTMWVNGSDAYETFLSLSPNFRYEAVTNCCCDRARRTELVSPQNAKRIIRSNIGHAENNTTLAKTGFEYGQS